MAAQQRNNEKSGMPPADETHLQYAFHGPGRRRSWFEGWYFKFTLDHHATLSLIPSLHLKNGKLVGSLQWIIAKDHVIYSDGRMYAADEVHWTRQPFSLTIGGNTFSETGLSIQETALQVEAGFDSIQPYRGDIMGPFRFFHSQMPCSHGLVAPRGQATVRVESDLIQGSYRSGLYVEKDWGDTFPERYIWIQADFPEAASSLFFSIATVKVGRLGFDGFIAHLTLDRTEYTFATWNLAQCRVDGSEEDLRITLANEAVKCLIRIQPQAAVRLKSPVDGHMGSSIRESLQAPIQLLLQNADGSVQRLRSSRASMEYHEWFHKKP